MNDTTPKTNLRASVPDQRTASDEHSESNPGLQYGYATADQIPGNPCTVKLIYFFTPTTSGGTGATDRNSYNEVHNVDKQVHDAFYANCTLREEIVSFIWDVERNRYNFAGQHGLTRRLQVNAVINAGATGPAELRDGQNSTVVQLKNTTEDPLQVGDVVWAQYIANIGADTYDNTGITVNPPIPVPIRDGEWQTISSSAGGGHKFIKLASSLDAADHQAAAVIPTSAIDQAVWEWNAAGTQIVVSSPLEQLTVYNVSEQDLEPGFYRIEKYGHLWVIDVGGGMGRVKFAKLEGVLGKPTVGGGGEVTPATVGNVTVYSFQPDTGTYDPTMTSQTIHNPIENMTFGAGYWPVTQVDEDTWMIVGGRVYGDIICRLDLPGTTGLVMVPNNGMSLASYTHYYGPDEPDPLPGESAGTVEIHNPHNIVGWNKLHCKWNYAQERYEIVDSNLPQGALWPVALTTASGGPGDGSTRTNTQYNATPIDDTARFFPGGPFDANSVADAHPYGDFRPDRGQLAEARFGAMYYDGTDFKLYDAREKWCVVSDSGAFA